MNLWFIRLIFLFCCDLFSVHICLHYFQLWGLIFQMFYKSQSYVCPTVSQNLHEEHNVSASGGVASQRCSNPCGHLRHHYYTWSKPSAHSGYQRLGASGMRIQYGWNINYFSAECPVGSSHLCVSSISTTSSFYSLVNLTTRENIHNLKDPSTGPWGTSACWPRLFSPSIELQQNFHSASCRGKQTLILCKEREK